MSRQEETQNAALEYANSVDYPMWCDGDTSNSKIKMLVSAAYEDGARWADENPKSPWISVNERLPEIDEEMHRSETVYVISENSKYPDIDFRFSYANGKEAWWNPKTDYTHWMPVPELPNRD